MTITLDRNEQFTAERRQQIEAARSAQAAFDQRVTDGKLRDLGNGRFQVTDPDSWDNGEILLRQSDGQILPQHGLDTTTGKAALYVAGRPAWHELGNVIPEGTNDIDEALSYGGIGWLAKKRPVTFTPEGSTVPLTVPGQFVNYRDDTNAPLGVVGKVYHIVQNRQAFEFLQDLVCDMSVRWESAGALREGRKVFVSIRLPQSVVIDAEGINDEIRPYVAVINSHDGSSNFEAVVTPWRIECGNTERFAIRDAKTRWSVRHTKNATSRIAEARRTLQLSLKYYDGWAAEEEALARTSVEIDEFRKVIQDLYPAPDETSTRKVRNHQERLNALTAKWERNAEKLGRTGYAAERAITEYLDWATTQRPTGSLKGRDLAARGTAMIEGTNDEMKSKAHRRLLTLVNR
ncbi:DUF932 domain-containing protein [Dactylosporangium sp. CA-139066]|uniref:DUF932 domain-containing protein n=1 Tax=Dactylosporangium sp. CA-139066 TaxID=3239930 RepID=UPI003D927F13